MEILEEVKGWLEGFPGFDGGPIQIDRLGAAPQETAIFSKGMEVLGSMEDVLGNRKNFIRCTFLLQQVTAAPDGEQAARLLAFQQWVMAQSAHGLAPQLGADTRWRAEQGQLSGSKGAGTGVYAVKLTAEFTQVLGYGV